jgi:hypothetical protein
MHEVTDISDAYGMLATIPAVKSYWINVNEQELFYTCRDILWSKLIWGIQFEIFSLVLCTFWVDNIKWLNQFKSLSDMFRLPKDG